ASQIVQDVFGSAKRWLGVDDPVFSKQGAQKRPEGFFVGQREAFPVERQMVGEKSASQSGHELSAKDTAENPDRQEEVAWCGEPALVIGCQSSARHNTVNMWMRLQGLSPGVQDAEEADLSTEVFRIRSHFQQSGSRGVEQEREQDLLVLPNQLNEQVRHAEDEMKIVYRQQLLLALGEPLLASVGRALWTMPILTGVVGDAGQIS